MQIVRAREGDYRHNRPLPDIGYLISEMKRPHVTLHLLWYRESCPDGYGYTQSQILGFDPADKDAWAWAKACVCSTQARHGDVEAAYKGYEELAFSLPASDRRIAIIAAADIAISEIEAYDDWQMMEWVEHAECMIRDTETLFPSEQ